MKWVQWNGKTLLPLFPVLKDLRKAVCPDCWRSCSWKILPGGPLLYQRYIHDNLSFCLWFEVINYRFHYYHCCSKIPFLSLFGLHSWKILPIHSGTAQCCRMCNKLLEILADLLCTQGFTRIISDEANPSHAECLQPEQSCMLFMSGWAFFNI